MLDFCPSEFKALSHGGKLLRSEIGKTVMKTRMASICPTFSHSAFDYEEFTPGHLHPTVFSPSPHPNRAHLQEGKVLISFPLSR